MPVLSKKQRDSVVQDKDKTVVKAGKTPKPAKRSRTTRLAVYKSVTTDIRAVDNLLTADQAKDLLGWREEEKGKKALNKPPLLVINDKLIYCDNNTNNRPLYLSVVETLKQEILRKHWVFNGEPIIIGRTGLIINGQHTLLALILAAQVWRVTPSEAPAWSKEPTIAKLIVYGIDENDVTVNTMDTCKPRTLADVIYRAKYFKELPPKDQKRAAAMADKAIKLIWEKTGDVHAWVKRTHSESVAFLEHHRRILDAVIHIYQENGDNNLGKYVSPGCCAAVMYLMATSKSDPKAYYGADQPSEALLDFMLWDKASNFFVELASGSTAFSHVRNSIASLARDGNDGLTNRMAVIAKAWVPFSAGQPITAKLTTLRFEVRDDAKHLDIRDVPLFGGIDVGEDGLAFATNGDPKKHEIAAKAEKVRSKRHEPKFVANRKGDTWSKGDKAWVHNKNDAAYPATLSDHPYPTAEGIEKVFVDAEDGQWEVNVMDLSAKEFELV